MKKIFIALVISLCLAGCIPDKTIITPKEPPHFQTGLCGTQPTEVWNTAEAWVILDINKYVWKSR